VQRERERERVNPPRRSARIISEKSKRE